MIDTDKYTGHDNWEGTKVNMTNEANVRLIADAPLLLAEVKRLNAYLESLFDGGNLDVETYVEYKERIE